MEKVSETKVEVPKVMWCPVCHHMTLELIRKAWEERPFMHYTELRGYYKCRNCGNNCYKVFAKESI